MLEDSLKALLGYNYGVADKIFSKPYEVGDKIKVNGKKFNIIGFYESIGNPGDDSNVYLIKDDMEELYDDLSYGMIIAKVYNPQDMSNIVENTEKKLRKIRELEEGKEDFVVQSYEDALAMFTDVLNIVVGFIFLIVIISAVVASVNTANTMVTSVLERIREIGVMKSIGATNTNIRNIFLFESSIIGATAGIIGVAIGWAFAGLGGLMLKNLGWGFLAPSFTPAIFIGAIALATLVGTVSGMAPAIYAAKQKPVDALRYE